MSELQPRSGAEVVSAVNDNTVLRKGERLSQGILQKWVGDYIGDASAAATGHGLLVAGNMLSRGKAESILKAAFAIRHVDNIHWSTFYEAFLNGTTAVVSRQELEDRLAFAELTTPIALPVIDPRTWQDQPVPDREWFVDGMIPSRTVTNLTGDGGSGKTELMLQLIAASSLRTEWFGKKVAMGPCLYYGAEDEADELHRRLATIVRRSGRKLSELNGIRLIPMAEADAVLAEPDKSGKLLETRLFGQLRFEAERLCPKLIVVDPAADVFGGDEINRSQVRRFVSMLRTLAIELDCAVLLLSHPSITGLISGTGSSGSTAWRNSVRSRLYLAVPSTNGKPDPNVRLLQVQKANYGRTGEELKVRWDDGIYVLDKGIDAATENIINARVDSIFLELLRLFTEQQQNLCTSPGTSYAPAKMLKHPKAKGYSKDQLAVAMQRLLDSNRIKVVTEGTKSRPRSRLALVEAE